MCLIRVVQDCVCQSHWELEIVSDAEPPSVIPYGGWPSVDQASIGDIPVIFPHNIRIPFVLGALPADAILSKMCWYARPSIPAFNIVEHVIKVVAHGFNAGEVRVAASLTTKIPWIIGVKRHPQVRVIVPGKVAGTWIHGIDLSLVPLCVRRKQDEASIVCMSNRIITNPIYSSGEFNYCGVVWICGVR